jgi:hypothetical protein
MSIAFALADSTSVQTVFFKTSPRMLSCERRAIHESIQALGGFSALFYLLGKATPGEVEQAAVLRLIFACLKYSVVNISEFIDLRGHLVLAHYLKSPRAVIGWQVLDILLDAAFSDLVQRPDGHLNVSERSVVKHPDIVVGILIDWQVWIRAPVGVWRYAVSQLALVVNPQCNHFAEFNSQLLRESQAIPYLFMYLQERDVFPGEVSISLVRVIHHLLQGQRSSVAATEIASIMDFLTASHRNKALEVHGPTLSTPAQRKQLRANKQEDAKTPKKTPKSGQLATLLRSSSRARISMSPVYEEEEHIGSAVAAGGIRALLDTPPSTPLHSTPMVFTFNTSMSAIEEEPSTAKAASSKKSLQFGRSLTLPGRSVPSPSQESMANTPPPSSPLRVTPPLLSASPPTIAIVKSSTNLQELISSPSTPVRSASVSKTAPSALSEIRVSAIKRNESSFLSWWNHAESHGDDDVEIRLGMLGIVLDRVSRLTEADFADARKTFTIESLILLAENEDVAVRFVCCFALFCISCS